MEVTLNTQDEFTVWIAKAFVDAEQEPVQFAMLEAIAEDANVGDDLDTQLKHVQTSQRQAGAFGLELAGAFLLPVLIELGKQLWKAYSEELMKQLGINLAELTAKKLKVWLNDQLDSQHEEVVTNQMEVAIRRLGDAHNLNQEQVSALIAAVRQGHVKKRLRED